MSEPALKSLLPPELKEGLTPAERLLMLKAEKGQEADFRVGDAQVDNPKNGGSWDADRTIRAEFLYWLCTDDKATKVLHPKGVILTGVKIPTLLDFGDCSLTRPIVLEGCALLEGIALDDCQITILALLGCLTTQISGDRLSSSGRIELQRIQVEGEVRLLGARIGGGLDCSGAKLKNPEGYALNADGLVVEGPVFLRDGFEVEGEVRLLGVRIGGGLDCSGAKLKNPEGYALNADGLVVGGPVFLRDGFEAEGEVRLVGAKIGGYLDCGGAKLKHPEGYALNADKIAAEGPVFLRDGFEAEGEVWLVGAKIRGGLDCGGAKLKNPEGYALNADKLAAEDYVFLGEGFEAEGEVGLPGAKIGGNLDCKGASLKNSKGGALNIKNAQIQGFLLLNRLRGLVGVVDLTHAQVGQLVDDDASWPEKQKLLLDGFVYGAFGGAAPRTASERLKWLALQPVHPFRPQPYEQLAKVFRSVGRESDARTVLIAKQEGVRKYGDLTRKGRLWNWFLGRTIGHGYEPWKVILRFILPIVLLGWGVFWCADRETLGIMQPTSESVYKAFEESGKVGIPKNYPSFNPLVYSVDVFIPFVKLHQENYWLPTSEKPFGGYFRLYLWVHIALGWIFSTLAVAALAGLVRKE